MGLATFWAIFSQTQLVTLVQSSAPRLQNSTKECSCNLHNCECNWPGSWLTQSARIRVTRLGEFSTFGWFLLWVVFRKLHKSPNFLGHFNPRNKLCINFCNTWFEIHFGQMFFATSSGHPATNSAVNKHSTDATVYQGWQISLGSWHQNRKKMYQMNTQCPTWSYNIPYVQKIFQMSIIYINLYQSENLKKFPKLGFLVWKQTIWQPCSVLYSWRTNKSA
jgi:hypothetical protein